MIAASERKQFGDEIRARRRRGRPRSAVPSVITSVKIPRDEYDALARHALAERQSVHAIIRDAISARAKLLP